ncbi:MAG: hypothetical protein GYA41_10780 [Bacteroidales bacterium]|nr:hypothetical protein [Bacteroidales bacterium]
MTGNQAGDGLRTADDRRRETGDWIRVKGYSLQSTGDRRKALDYNIVSAL